MFVVPHGGQLLRNWRRMVQFEFCFWFSMAILAWAACVSLLNTVDAALRIIFGRLDEWNAG